jgi:hypothetical protein
MYSSPVISNQRTIFACAAREADESLVETRASKETERSRETSIACKHKSPIMLSKSPHGVTAGWGCLQAVLSDVVSERPPEGALSPSVSSNLPPTHHSRTVPHSW